MKNLNFALILFVCTYLSANETHHLADSHAPISVMGDHMHKKNEIMFSYRLGKMYMSDIFNGTKKVSENLVMSSPNGASDGTGTYMNSPISMNMEMHMFGGMYAPNDNITLMIMGSYLNKEMISQRMPMAGGARWYANSSGFGDLRISGMFNMLHSKKTKSHLGIGMSLPTGSINKRDTTPNSSNSRLGYAMQNGSGSYDPFIFFNNVNTFGKIKLGEQIFFKKPSSGKNSKGYNYGSSFESRIWSSYRLIHNLSSSIQINYKYQGSLKGEDNEMNPRMSPAMDSKNHGYQKLNLSFGVNYVNHGYFLNNNRLGFEVTLPLFSRFSGLQMGEKYRIMIGWQYGF